MVFRFTDLQAYVSLKSNSDKKILVYMCRLLLKESTSIFYCISSNIPSIKYSYKTSVTCCVIKPVSISRISVATLS